ncbi:MAG: radical SAM protein [Nitrospinae bacterium]|nr:radical SAM protein [Nitrospinota bacterium]
MPNEAQGKEFVRGHSGLYETLCKSGNWQAAQEGRLHTLLFEITDKCFGSCKYCFSASNEHRGLFLPPETVYSILDDAWEMGVREILLSGGDPLLHPNWYEFACYMVDKGFILHVLPSLLLSKKQAKQIVDLGAQVLIHIDTLNQEDYNEVHHNPRTLEAKIQGYRNLLEAGMPPEKAWVCITYTRAAARHIEETVDWHVDEMGANWINFAIFKTEGFGSPHQSFEPSVEEIKRALLYRAKKFNDESSLRFGSSDAGKCFCKTYFVLKPDGRVTPCPMLSALAVGNIHQTPFRQLVESNLDRLTFNFEVQGYCGEECPDREVCFGCRAVAYHYTGDVTSSDPKCWKNPANEDYVFEAGAGS